MHVDKTRDERIAMISSVSPHVIHELTHTFVASLIQAVGPHSEIHLVCDGVASTYKNQQQIERLKGVVSNVGQYMPFVEKYNRGHDDFEDEHISRHYLQLLPLHLFAEEGMIAAFYELQQQQQVISISNVSNTQIQIHYAPYEAEGYIAHQLLQETSGNGSSKQNRIVFSNDSDFFIFPSVCSIVPLHLLQFQMNSSCATATASSENKDDDSQTEDTKTRSSIDFNTSIHGWEYQREKFVNAFDLETKNQKCNLLITSTIAALAGCDYTLDGTHEHCITNARKAIVQSDIGGLRQKDRNHPSAKDTLIAVIRFVQCFVSQYNDDTNIIINNKDLVDNDYPYDGFIWFQKCIEKIVALKCELPRKKKKKKQQKKSTSSCKDGPILSHAISLIFNIYNRESTLWPLETNNTRLSQEFRRLVRHKTIFCKPVLEKRHFNDDDEDLRNVCSLWKEDRFQQFRCRLYAFMKLLSDRDMPLDSSFTSTFTEYHQSDSDISFPLSLVECDGAVDDRVLRQSNLSVLQMIKVISFGLHEAKLEHHKHTLKEKLVIDSHLHPLSMVLISASFLLSEKDALILFVMTSSSMFLHLTQKQVNTKFDKTIFNHSCIESISRIQISLFHIRLSLEVIEKYMENNCDKMRKNESTKLLTAFHENIHKIFSTCIICTHVLNDFEVNGCANSSTAFKHKVYSDRLFSTVREHFESRYDCNGDLDQWHSYVTLLWKVYLNAKPALIDVVE